MSGTLVFCLYKTTAITMPVGMREIPNLIVGDVHLRLASLSPLNIRRAHVLCIVIILPSGISPALTVTVRYANYQAYAPHSTPEKLRAVKNMVVNPLKLLIFQRGSSTSLTHECRFSNAYLAVTAFEERLASSACPIRGAAHIPPGLLVERLDTVGP